MLKKILCLFTLSLAAVFCQAETAAEPAVKPAAEPAAKPAAEPAAKPAVVTHDWNGVWSDAGTQEFQYCYLVIAQEGSTLHTAHYLEFKGMPMVEYGVGTVKDGVATIKVTVTKAIPGWATAGVHTLRMSADGNVLRGEYVDTKGNKGPIAYGRFRQKS
jgi:hypothetical protein